MIASFFIKNIVWGCILSILVYKTKVNIRRQYSLIFSVK